MIEPHFLLLFPDRLPAGLRTPWVRWPGRVQRYDGRLPGPWQAERLLRDTGWRARQCSDDAVAALLATEAGAASPLARCLARVPSILWRILRRQFPTLIPLAGKK